MHTSLTPQQQTNKNCRSIIKRWDIKQFETTSVNVKYKIQEIVLCAVYYLPRHSLKKNIIIRGYFNLKHVDWRSNLTNASSPSTKMRNKPRYWPTD